MPPNEKTGPPNTTPGETGTNTNPITTNGADGCQSTANGRHVTGYAGALPLYVRGGWPSVLPLERGTKYPPPPNCTGYHGHWPSLGELAAWGVANPDGNTALRLPDTVVVLDVDHYGDKQGGLTLGEAERRWGPLPATYRNSARAAPSGHRFYLVPPGTKLAGQITFSELKLGHVEILQSHHRYAVVWPSVNQNGDVYQWYAPDGSPCEPPSVDDLPELPQRWLEELSADKPRASTSTPRAHNDAEIPGANLYDVSEALTAGPMSARVAQRLASAVGALYGSGCRHDETRNHTLALTRMGKQGERGVLEALTTLMGAFISAVTADASRTEEEARAEYLRFLTNARAGVLLMSRTPLRGPLAMWMSPFGGGQRFLPTSCVSPGPGGPVPTPLWARCCAGPWAVSTRGWCCHPRSAAWPP